MRNDMNKFDNINLKYFSIQRVYKKTYKKLKQKPVFVYNHNLMINYNFYENFHTAGSYNL